MDPKNMNEVIGGKRYETEKSTLLASDVYWDGNNFERHGRNTFLFLTPNGGYFLQRESMWQDELRSLEPLDESEALRYWEELPIHEVDFSAAFPNVKVVNA